MIFPGYFKVTDLGRYKVQCMINASTQAEFMRKVKRHLMSNEVLCEYDHETKKGEITVSGFRVVGRFERVGEHGQEN